MTKPIDIKFPKDVENFIHELCAKAIVRAMRNGTYKGSVEDDAKETYGT